MTLLNRRSAVAGALAAGASAALGGAGAAEARRVHGPAWRDAEDFVDRIGVNTHLGQRDSVYDRFFDASIAPAIQDLGIRRVRDGAFEVVPGRTDVFYGRIRALARAGCRFSAICYDPTNRYVRTPPRALPGIYEQFEGALDTFEGGNEPELVADPALNPTLSWLHQRELHDTIRRDLAGRSVSLAAPSYIQANIALARPLRGLADLSNLHAYPGMEHPETAGPGRLAGFREAMVPVCGPVDSVLTETGYHSALATGSSHLPVSEGIRARYMPRLLLFAYLSGMRRTFLYELRSSFERGPADPESAFGLLTYDGRPTPAYHAVKRLIALFSRPPRGGPRPAGAPERIATSGDHADLFAEGFRTGDGRLLLPVWLGVAGWDSGPRLARPAVARRLRLECGGWGGGLTAHRFDDDGSVRAERLHLADGTADLLVSDRLTVLEFAA